MPVFFKIQLTERIKLFRLSSLQVRHLKKHKTNEQEIQELYYYIVINGKLII